jgi:hypothetical protein
LKTSNDSGKLISLSAAFVYSDEMSDPTENPKGLIQTDSTEADVSSACEEGFTQA